MASRTFKCVSFCFDDRLLRSSSHLRNRISEEPSIYIINVRDFKFNNTDLTCTITRKIAKLPC